MKKLLMLLVTSVLALSLVACGSSTEPTPTATPEGEAGGETTGTEYTGPTEMTLASSIQPTTLDYVVTALSVDHQINVNLVDGLLEHDSKGNLVPSLAESWEPNEDSSVWTFKIREGAKWVTNLGEEYEEVTAHDFVTGVRHGAEFGSGTSWLLMGVIEGYTEYLASDFSDEAWDSVGVKAIDDYTLEFTMEIKEDGTGTPVPYFPSMTTYAVLYPVNEIFLESKGTGCALGAPDKETCEYGTSALDSILYNGAYLLVTNDVKSTIVLEKNEANWDADKVYIETITYIYDDGSDPYSVINGFEQGTYVSASLSPSWENYDDYADKYADNTYFTLPNSYVFGLVFNYNRQSFDYTNYADDETLRANTHDAIMNANFRNAIKYAWDRTAYLATRSPLELAEATLRNVNSVDALATTSDGKGYYTLVEEAYTELTGETVVLDDGQNPYLNKDTALAYIEAAKEDGVEFPVHLDMLVNETSDALLTQANSMKTSIEANTDGQIIIELVLEDADTVEAIAYLNTDPAGSDYDISTYTGWGPDYQDPKTFVDIYSPTTGYYMDAMGLGTVDANGEILSLDIKEAVGWMEYEELYRAADAITDDLDARYAAFAKADAYLIANALYIPNSQRTRGQNVSYIVPFTAMYSVSGTDQYKYKGMQLQDEIVTKEQYSAAEAEWAQ